MSRLQLTPLGEFVVRHSVMTPIDWWRTLYADAERFADEGGDMDLFFQEKIHGLVEMRSRLHELMGNDED